MQSKHMPTARIECSEVYSSYTYGEHASPIISVTHTRYDQDPTDIPKGKYGSNSLMNHANKDKQRYTSYVLTRIDNIWG